jgi:hypothetical protein
MPGAPLIEAFDAARARHAAAVAEFVPLLIELAFAFVTEVLPGADMLTVRGEMNEDWAFTLRVQRVLDREGGVLYDVGIGHEDPAVEDTIDQVGVDYLDLLMHLTGDEYLGHSSIRRRTTDTNRCRPPGLASPATGERQYPKRKRPRTFV